MNREANIARFEAELAKVQRPGMGLLLEYIRHSDFYTAPASTHYRLSCEGGLLQHSLNVLDALRGLLMKEPDGKDEAGNPKVKYHYVVADKFVATFPQDSVIITALLHDICKTFFYTTSTKNVKNEKTGKWEKVPYYTVDDKMPLGHGAKSAMIIKQYTELTTPEMYAIWWHMGFTGSTGTDTATISQAIDKHPLIWALHTADMMASHFMEGEKGNLEAFTDRPRRPPGSTRTHLPPPKTESRSSMTLRPWPARGREPWRRPTTPWSASPFGTTPTASSTP